MTKKRIQSNPSDPGYPSWTTPPDESPADPSRRRFLRRIATTTGGVGLLAAIGLPKLAHGQSHEVDFSVLDAHPEQSAAPQAAELAPAAPSRVAAPAPTAVPAAPMPAAAPTAEPAQAPADPALLVELVTEDRALWIEPGYLVLIRWNRPADNNDVVAALEGMTDAVQSYLASSISVMEDLHDLPRLHTHEQSLVALIDPQIVPARIEKLHLDHDCNTVCNSFGWTDPTGPDIPLPGMPMPTSWA